MVAVLLAAVAAGLALDPLNDFHTALTLCGIPAALHNRIKTLEGFTSLEDSQTLSNESVDAVATQLE
jgi:hypothetical protein